jgi:hypothetical protein
MAALTNSPFGLLDAHSSLHLITDFVHEDVSLCLALVCCALRDALWTRFPARPAGHPHVGNSRGVLQYFFVKLFKSPDLRLDF